MSFLNSMIEATSIEALDAANSESPASAPAVRVLKPAVESSTNSIEAKIRSSFDFEVNKLQLSGPSGQKTPFYGLFRSDNNDNVGSAVKAGYEPHTTEDVVSLANAAKEAFDGECKVNCNWNSGHFVTIAPSAKHRRSIFGKKDNVFPRLMINAQYGRTFQATIGWYRDACKNLAMVRSVNAFSKAIRHTSGLRGKMPELISTFRQLAANWDDAVKTIKRMEQTEVNLKDFLAELYPTNENDSQRSKNIASKRIEAIFRRVAKERLTTDRPEINKNWIVSGWEAYNGVQGYSQHDKSRKGSPTKFDRAMLAMEDKEVIEAEKLILSA